jgi:transcription initiation factor IIE alpha subunit
MPSNVVLQHLKKHGQLLDSEIAASTKLSIEEVRLAIDELSRRRRNLAVRRHPL